MYNTTKEHVLFVNFQLYTVCLEFEKSKEREGKPWYSLLLFGF